MKDTLIYIASCIRKVRSQLGSSCTDNIDEAIESDIEASTKKLCSKCGGEADPNFRVCRIDDCGGKLIKQTSKAYNNEPMEVDMGAGYKEFEQVLPNTTCKTEEPDFLNPNSFQNLILILQNIGYRAGIKQYGVVREWLPVECDG